MFTRLGALSATLLLASLSTADAALISNGSFETQTPPVSGAYFALADGSTRIDGWTVGGGGIELINTLWTSADGNYSLDLSRDTAGTIEQTLTGLIIGTTYRVSFALAGNPDGGETIKNLEVSAGSVTQQFQFDITGATRTDMGWQTETLDFLAVDTSAVLSFRSLELNGGYGPALDNVTVAAVPLPAGVLMLLGGLGALGFVGLRRRG